MENYTIRYGGTNIYQPIEAKYYQPLYVLYAFLLSN